MKTRQMLMIAVVICSVGCPFLLAVEPATVVKTKPFPPARVRLMESAFKKAMEINRAYLLRLDADRFLWPFHERAGMKPKGERYGGWEKVPNTERMLRRQRIAPEQWRKIHVEYLPSLSVYVDAVGKSQPVRFTLPKTVDPSRGRCPNTAPEIKTAPHVSGL